MSAVPDVLSGLGTTPPAPGSNAFGDLKSADFIKVMLSELSNQDPFEPQDSSALLEQLSSLRNIESQISLQEDLKSLVLQNGLSSAGGMIGRVVKGLDESNNEVEGLVVSLKVRDGDPILQLDNGTPLPADRVTEIVDFGDMDVQLVQALLADLNLLQSGGLIGKLVNGTDDDGNEMAGIVTAVRIDQGAAILELDSGQELKLSKVDRFSDPA